MGLKSFMRHKRGYTREDGMRLWTYSKQYPEGRWVTPEKFESLFIQGKEAYKEHIRNPENLAKVKDSQKRHLAVPENREKINAAARERARRPEVRARNNELRRTPEGRERRRKQYAAWRKTPAGKIIDTIRKHVIRAAKRAGTNKPSRSIELLGTDLETFRTYMEERFTEGMTWENHGEWEVDHITPLSSGKTPDEIWALCHYTNLQPLWAEDNRRKGAKITASFVGS